MADCCWAPVPTQRVLLTQHVAVPVQQLHVFRTPLAQATLPPGRTLAPAYAVQQPQLLLPRPLNPAAPQQAVPRQVASWLPPQSPLPRSASVAPPPRAASRQSPPASHVPQPVATAPAPQPLVSHVPQPTAASHVPQLQTAAAPQLPAAKQESDFLEEMKPGASRCDEVTGKVQLVSLGCYCGPKLSFQQIGRGAETLPFDWIRTRLEGILHFLRSDFEGFFDWAVSEPVPGAQGMVSYRNYLHSFWHDDPNVASMREKYQRRMERFRTIKADERPVLFVRAAGELSELLLVPELLAELRQRFGGQVRLLVVLDFQVSPHEAMSVQGLPGLLIFYLNREKHDCGGFGPYCDPVMCGLDWAVGRDVGAGSFSSLEEAIAAAEPLRFGRNGLGGLPAFEEAPSPELSGRLAASALRAAPLTPRSR